MRLPRIFKPLPTLAMGVVLGVLVWPKVRPKIGI